MESSEAHDFSTNLNAVSAPTARRASVAEPQVRHVISRCFAEFAENSGVVMIDDVTAALRAGAKFDAEVRFVPGQGLQDEQVHELLAAATRAGQASLFARWDREGRAASVLTHKRRPVNTLISTPARVAENRYEARLCIDERNELMADHLVGAHIPAMVLIEAARQMFIASFELHLNLDRAALSFLVSEFNTSFLQLAFPLSTSIGIEIAEQSSSPSARSVYTATAEVMQAGVRVSSHSGRVHLCSTATAMSLEKRNARRVLRVLGDAVSADAIDARTEERSATC